MSAVIMEAEPLHVQAVRELRELADSIESAGGCRGLIFGAIVDDERSALGFGGESGAIEELLGRVRSTMDEAVFIDADTDFDALDAEAD